MVEVSNDVYALTLFDIRSTLDLHQIPLAGGLNEDDIDSFITPSTYLDQFTLWKSR